MPKGEGLSLARTMGQAKSFGQGVMKKAWPIFTVLQGLDMLEQYSQSENDVSKMNRMEARMYERLEIADETLEVAKQSPLLANSRSMQQLESAMKEGRKYLESIKSFGPLLRGASKTKIVGKLERYSLWLTDALVAVQVDTMLAATRGLSAGGTPQMLADLNVLWHRYYYPVGGGAPVQMLGPTDQDENASMGRQPQPLLMPSPTPSQQQVAPADNLHGSQPKLTDSDVQEETNQGTEAEATPAGAAGGQNTSGIVYPMMHPSTAAAASALKEFDGAGWPNNALHPMAMHQAPPAPGQSIGFDEAGWPGNSEIVGTRMMMGYTPSATLGAPAVYHGAGWSHSFLPTTIMTQPPTTPTPTAFPGEDGRLCGSASASPMMLHHTPVATMGAPTMNFDGVTWYRTFDPASSMMGHTPVKGHPPASPDGGAPDMGDPMSRTTPLPRPPSVRKWYECLDGDHVGASSSCRTLPLSASSDSVRTPSPNPHHYAPQKGEQPPGAAAGGESEWAHPSDSIHGATKQLREALGIGNTASHDHSDSVSQSRRGVNGTLRPKMIVYDSTGVPYNFDVDTGQCYPYYPAGWGHDPSGLLNNGGPHR